MTALWFAEEMSGTVAAERMTLRLTVRVDDVDTFLSEPEHLAHLEGSVDAASLGGRRPIERGWFNLFVPGDTSDRREMRYRMWLTDSANQPRTIVGVKDVHHGTAARLWIDTSTLFTRVLAGHVAPGEDAVEESSGTLRIQPVELAAMLASFRTEGPDGVAALARFGTFFLGELWDLYQPS
jgi:cholesterol oxidase